MDIQTHDEQSAGTSPAPPTVEQAVTSGDQAAFSAARRRERSQPAQHPPVADATADSSPASGESPASTEVSAAVSETAPPAKKGIKARSAELDTEITALQEKLRLRAELRQQVAEPPTVSDAKPAVSSPAPVVSDKPTWASFESQIGTTFETWAAAQDAYADARDSWKETQTRLTQQRTEQQTQVQTAFRTTQDRIAAYVQTDPEFWGKVSDAVTNLQPLSVARAKDPQVVRNASHDLAEGIVTSEFAPQWMLHLSQHPDVLTQLVSAPSPEAVYRLMGRIEASFVPASTPSPQTFTHVPEPPTTLGRRPADPTDETEAIVASGDMDRFKALKQRLRVAQLR